MKMKMKKIFFFSREQPKKRGPWMNSFTAGKAGMKKEMPQRGEFLRLPTARGQNQFFAKECVFVAAYRSPPR